MIKSYNKNYGDHSVRIETTYKLRLSKEEMLIVLNLLDTAPFFDFGHSAESLREKLISLYPELSGE